MAGSAQIIIENIFIGFFLTLICVLGIIGNFISFSVLLHQQRKKHKNSINYLLIGLSLSDILFLFTWLNVGSIYTYRLFGGEHASQNFATLSAAYFNLIIRPIGYIGKIQIASYILTRTISSNSCLTWNFISEQNKCFVFLGQAGGNLFTVAITVDRYLAVCHSSLAKRIWSLRRALYLSIAIFLISIIFSMPIWFALEVDTAPENDGFLVRNNEFGETLSFKAYNLWLYTSINTIIPFPILIVLNGFIFKQVISILFIHLLRHCKLSNPQNHQPSALFSRYMKLDSTKPLYPSHKYLKSLWPKCFCVLFLFLVFVTFRQSSVPLYSQSKIHRI